jgi:hypothetical protein
MTAQALEPASGVPEHDRFRIVNLLHGSFKSAPVLGGRGMRDRSIDLRLVPAVSACAFFGLPRIQSASKAPT